MIAQNVNKQNKQNSISLHFISKQILEIVELIGKSKLVDCPVYEIAIVGWA